MSTFISDKIFCGIGQNEDGSIYGVGGPFGAGETLAGPERPAVVNIPVSLIPGPEVQDTLKLKGLTGEVTIACHGDIVGGLEDCVDVTRCTGDIILIVKGALKPTGKHVLIIKGESDGVRVVARVDGHGKQTDVEQGGFYGGGSLPLLNGRTKNIRLEMVSAEPIRLRVFRSEPPTIRNGQAYDRHAKWLEFFYPVWLWFRERGIGK